MAGPLDILKSLLSDPNNTAAPEAGGSSASPAIMQMLQENGLMTPIDQKQEMRNAIATGLQGLAKGLIANPNYDFAASLANGLADGAGGFIGATNDSDKKTRDQAQDLMKELFGIAKAEDMSGYRTQNLALRQLLGEGRLEQGDRRLDQGDARVNQGQQRVDETGRHNLVTEGQGSIRLEQGEDRVGQGQQRIDETGRHNQTTEEIAAANAEERKRANQEREKTQAERNKLLNNRIVAQTKKAEADAKAAQHRVGKSALDEENTRTTIFARLEGLKSAKAKELGLDNPTTRLLYPDQYEEKVKEYEAYKQALDKQLKSIGPNSSDAPQTDGPQPVPPPNEAKTSQVTKWTEKNPAYPKSKAEFDALPPGSVFYNPKTKTLKRKPANGGQVPPQ